MASNQIKDGFNGGSDNQLKVNADGSINVDATAIVVTPVDVNIRDSSGNPINSTAGSLNVDVTNTVSVTGPLTDAQLRAIPVPISGTVTANAGTGTFIVDGSAHTQPVSGTVTANQGTSPWVISGSTTVSGTVTANQGTTPWVVDGSGHTQPVSGTVAVSNFPATQAVTQSTSPWVVSGTVTANAGTGTFLVDGSAHTQPVSGTITANQGTSPWVVSGTVTTSPNVNVHDGAGNTIGSTGTSLNVDVTNTVPVTGPLTDTQLRATPVPVSGTVTANAGTGTFLVDGSAHTQPVSGTVAVTQSTSPWVVSGTVTTSPNVNVHDGAGNTISSTGTSLNVDVTNTVAVSGTVAISNFPATQPVSGTVAVTQSTSPWVVSGTVTANAGTNLNTSALALDTSVNAPQGSVTGGGAGTKSELAGAIYNVTPPTLTNGQQASLQFDVNGNLKTTATATVAGAVTVTGNVASGATDSGNPVKTGGVYNTTLPTPSNGQRVDTQSDLNGRTLVAAAPLDGYKATYSAAFTDLAAPSLATDIFTITGSATKTVRVLQMRASATQTSGTAYQDIQVIKRSTANSGGGASNIVVVQHAANSNAANANQITVTVTSTGAGNLIVVGASNGNNRTITSVTDGTTTFTQATGAAAQDTTLTSRSDIWYLLSSNAGKTTLTISFSGAAATFNKAAWAWEVSGMNSPTFGTGNAVNTGAQAGGIATGPSFTTASAQGFAVGLDTTSGAVTVNPQAGNSFTAGGDITSGDAGCSLIWAVPGTFNPAWTDGGTNFCSSLASFNNTAIAAPTLTAVSHDSNNAAATATVNVYTGLPTLGATVGLMRSSKLLIGQTTPSNAPTSTAQVPDHYRFGFGPEQAIVLRGTSQVLALNLNGVTTNGLFDLYMEWTEE